MIPSLKRVAQAAALYLAAAWVAAAAALFGLPDFTSLVEKNGPAVVNISTTQAPQRRPRLPRGLEIPELPEDSPFHDFFRHFFKDLPQQYDVRSLGSGFIISPDGYILTSAHVIENATEIVVRLTSRDEYEAEVVGSDRRSDVALLKIEAQDLPVVRIGDPQRLKVGEWVLAIGSPFGFENSATAGIVSAKGRSLPNETYVPFIQTDVAINPGNSGGPLFNLKGEVVGINAQIYSRTGGFMGLSFAVPIDLAMRVVEQLKRDGHVRRGWLGVVIQEVTRAHAKAFKLDKPRGALVADVLPDSPAADSDLRVGDVIVEYDGHPVYQSSQLPPLVGSTPVGKRVPLKVIRDGKPKTLEVTIGELPEAQQPAERQAEGPVPKPSRGQPILGMRLRDLNAAERKAYGVKGGAMVTDVEDGAAAAAGLRPGDVVLRAGDTKIGGAQALRKRLQALKPGEALALLVRRKDGSSLFLVLTRPAG